MNTDDLIHALHQMVETVHSSNDLGKCWHEILETTGGQDNVALTSTKIQSDLDSRVAQLKHTLDQAPPSSEIRLLWFRLFDGLRDGKEYAVYYLAGYRGEEQLVEGALPIPPYFPKSRYITFHLLSVVTSEAPASDGARVGSPYSTMR
jgi:hypothetical protein